MRDSLSLGRIATLACLLEVSAPKPGNVHRGADFEDMTFGDFLVSAVAVGDVFDRSGLSFGEMVLRAVEETNAAVGTNTNLGIVLLLSPLVAAAKSGDGSLTVQQVAGCLESLTPEDGQAVFEAIKKAKPGGTGEAAAMDLGATSGPVDLLAAMELSKNRDAIARQYVTGLDDVFGRGQRWLATGRSVFSDLNSAIVLAYVGWMAEEPDTLIARKCGGPVAEQARTQAAKAIDAIPAEVIAGQAKLTDEQAELFWQRVADFDFWLRSDGHRRNPGTTADLVAATLFVAIYNGTLKPPFR
jgi:triphosphoribosyl-dephospho-CoA synthase